MSQIPIIVTSTEIPLEPFRKENEQPELIIPYNSGERWFIPTRHVGVPGEGEPYVITEQGQLVRIPLFAYQTKTRAIHELSAVGLELGALMAAAMPNQIRRIHIVYGNSVVDLGDEINAFRLWVGCAMCVIR